MKINICYDIKDTPHGGANQFLKALKTQFIKKDIYSENAVFADIVLFNSHHNVDDLVKIKNLFPKKIYVHRIDGPMRLYNNMSDNRDDIVYRLNSIADGSIFQSQWSYEQNLNLGFRCKSPTAIIHNAPDPKIFNNSYIKEENDKFTLITTSWSNNVRKGFAYYDFLDKNLDFNKYDIYFAGRSPIEFKNIKMLGPLESADLSEHIKNSDAFLTASENDPCSNSLIEALSCGLPAIVLNSGGHPEIVKQGGYVFDGFEELIKIIEKIYYNIEICKKNIDVDSIDVVAEKYIDFFKRLV